MKTHPPDEMSTTPRGDSQSTPQRELPQLLESELQRLKRFIESRRGPVLRSVESSEDLVQSVVRGALECKTRFEYRGDNAFRAWLYKMARNKIAQRGRFWGAERRDARRLEALPDRESVRLPLTQESPSEVVRARELDLRLRTWIEELPSPQREVIALARLEGLDNVEIARRLGLAESSVRSSLSRGLAALSGKLLQSGQG